ncbi:Succinyl-diaminopimelate desuccinylase [archaeon HR01]|nr:Succinyl-diaminopimelate desuccinylase [archaeon HR01]
MPSEDTVRKLAEYVKRDHQLLSDLKMLVEQPSVSATGEGLEECANMVSDMLRREGFKVSQHRVDNGAPIILARMETVKPGRRILFYNHYDVQPPDPLSEWRTNPFQLSESDGMLYGRGIADDKGDIAARLAAVRAIRDRLGELPVSITWVIEGEEEVGSTHLESFVLKNAESLKADFCLWESGDISDDGRPNFYLGVKGMLYVELQIKTSEGDRHSMYAPILANPAEKMARLIASLKDERGRVRLKNFYRDVRRPKSSEMRLLRKIRVNMENLRRSLAAYELTARDGVEALEKLVLEPTCNIAGFSSGYQGPGIKTITPSTARVKMDIRLVPDQDPRKILSSLRRHVRGYGRFEIKVHSMCWPCRTSPDNPYVRLSTETGRAVYGAAPNIWLNMYGTGPMFIISRIGVPAAMLSCITHQGSRLHAPNENISLNHLWLAAVHQAAFLDSVSRVGSGPAS